MGVEGVWENMEGRGLARGVEGWGDSANKEKGAKGRSGGL